VGYHDLVQRLLEGLISLFVGLLLEELVDLPLDLCV
jgi:hypothetical protein